MMLTVDSIPPKVSLKGMENPVRRSWRMRGLSERHGRLYYVVRKASFEAKAQE